MAKNTETFDEFLKFIDWKYNMSVGDLIKLSEYQKQDELNKELAAESF